MDSIYLEDKLKKENNFNIKTHIFNLKKTKKSDNINNSNKQNSTYINTLSEIDINTTIKNTKIQNTKKN